MRSLKRKLNSVLTLILALAIFCGIALPAFADDEPEAAVTLEGEFSADAENEVPLAEEPSSDRPVVQIKAHQIAELAREDDLPEDHDIIVLSKNIWETKEAQLQNAEPTVVKLMKLMAAGDDPFVVERTAIQYMAHEIAESVRDMDEPEDNPMITLAQEIWAEEEAEIQAEYERRVELYKAAQRYDFLYGSGTILPASVTYDPAFEADAIVAAQVIFGEGRGGADITEMACIVWELVNRAIQQYGTIYGGTITKVATAPHQFNWDASFPTVSDLGIDLLALSRDVLYRARLEDAGEVNVGRVLPAGNWIYHHGSNGHNWFRDDYNSFRNLWDYSLESPYTSYWWYVENGIEPA